MGTRGIDGAVGNDGSLEMMLSQKAGHAGAHGAVTCCILLCCNWHDLSNCLSD